MDTRAQSLIKVLIIAAVITAGFAFRLINTPEPGSTVYSNDKKLSRSEGKMYYNRKLFTGAVIELYGNGDVFKVTSYKKGVEEGIQTAFLENGKIMEKRFYENGHKEGTHTGWWENGNLRFEFHFMNGLYEGNQKEWDESGMLYTDFNYVKGYEEGLQRAWYPDGTIQANYIVKNNRKYGLTGVKNCQSAKDETQD